MDDLTIYAQCDQDLGEATTCFPLLQFGLLQEIYVSEASAQKNSAYFLSALFHEGKNTIDFYWTALVGAEITSLTLA